MAKVTFENLGEAISEIMEEYSDSVYKATEKAVEATVKAGVNEIKSRSPVKTGAYRKGWRGKVEKTNVTTTGVIYNADRPGLPHLLEHGHAKVVGGRKYPDPVPGKVHIEPVQEKINDYFEDQIRFNLGEGEAL